MAVLQLLTFTQKAHSPRQQAICIVCQAIREGIIDRQPRPLHEMYISTCPYTKGNVYTHIYVCIYLVLFVRLPLKELVVS